MNILNYYKQRLLMVPFGWQALLLLVFSGFNVFLFGLRVLYSNKINYLFLNWNLFLAFLPFVLAIFVWRAYRNKQNKLFWFFLGLWLLFFPNSPYIMTDLIHLRYRDFVPIHFDAILIFSYALNGLWLGFFSLKIVHQVVGRRWGRVGGWTFIVFALWLSSLGIYIGRFLRWNSWDLFVDPLGVLADVFAILLLPFLYFKVHGLILVVFCFLLLSYLLLLGFADMNKQGGEI